MARITVEDCIDKFPSRFELVLVASNRARKLYTGENPTVEIDNDKNTVIALREIAEETLTKDQLKNDLIEEYQTTTFSEDEDLNEIEDNSDENQSEINELDTKETQQDVYSDKKQPGQEEFDVSDTHQDQENVNQTIEKTPIDTSLDSLENSSDEDKIQES